MDSIVTKIWGFRDRKELILTPLYVRGSASTHRPAPASQSEPSIARLTNHSTVFRHQMVAVIRCWPLTIACISTPTLDIGSILPVSFIIRPLHCTGASKYKHRENWKQKPAPGPRVQLGDGRILTRIARDDLSTVLGSQNHVFNELVRCIQLH